MSDAVFREGRGHQFAESRAHQRRAAGFLGYSTRLTTGIMRPPCFPAIFINTAAYPDNTPGRAMQESRRWFGRTFAAGIYAVNEHLDVSNNPFGTYQNTGSLSAWGDAAYDGTVRSNSIPANYSMLSEDNAVYTNFGNTSTWTRANEFDVPANFAQLRLMLSGENFPDLWLNGYNVWRYRDSDILPSSAALSQTGKPWNTCTFSADFLRGRDATNLFNQNDGAFFRDTGQFQDTNDNSGYGRLGGQASRSVSFPATGNALLSLRVSCFEGFAQAGGPEFANTPTLSVQRGQIMFYQDTQYAILETASGFFSGVLGYRIVTDTATAKAYIPVEVGMPSWSGWNILTAAGTTDSFLDEGNRFVITGQTATQWIAARPGAIHVP